MTLLPWPTTPASASRTLLVATLSTVALLLWFPPTGLARDTTRAAGKQTEQGRSLKTALLSAGVLRRGTGYRSEHGSAAVRGLQLRLRHLGFRPGPIDGLFGPLTQGAVERFQVARDLTADGVVGQKPRGLCWARWGRRAGVPNRVGTIGLHGIEPRPRRGHQPPASGGRCATSRRCPRHERRTARGGRAAAFGRARPRGCRRVGRPGHGDTAERRVAAWPPAPRRGIAGDRAEPERPSATNLRLGMVCASLLAVFAIGAVAGAFSQRTRRPTTVRQKRRAAPQRFLIGLDRPARRLRSGSVHTRRRAHHERADPHEIRDPGLTPTGSLRSRVSLRR